MNPMLMPMLAAISGESLMWLVIWLIIIGVIFWLVQTLVKKIPMDETVKVVINVVMYIGLTVLLINALLSLMGRGFIKW